MSSGFLLDTNVISKFNRAGKPNEHVKRWLDAVPEDSLYVSIITFAEIQFGIELLQAGKRRMQLEEWMGREFDSRFSGRILPLDADIVKRWAVLSAGRQMVGQPLAQFDGLIAATALKHGLTLVTRDVDDFRGLGVTLLNPWDDPKAKLDWPEPQERPSHESMEQAPQVREHEEDREH